MALPGLPTPQDQLEYYYTVREIIWRYKLDEVEGAVVARLHSLLEEMRREVSGRILRYRPEQYTRQRLEELLRDIETYSDAVKAATVKVIAAESGAAGAASLTEHADILSVGGKSSRVAGVSMGAADFGALMLSANVGGQALTQWVEPAFPEVGEAIFNAIRVGMFQGEGYQQIVRRVMAEATEATEREVITIARTYVQTANVAAQEAVFQRNRDVLGWLEWSAIMEPSYKQTGRGTCLVCASLDGRRYRQDEEKPEMPKHFGCRCHWKPIVDWEKLGIPGLAVEDATRPYTVRGDLNIGAGGRREILEVGMHKGNWASWASGRDEAFKINAIGPQRYALWQESGLNFEAFSKRLVNGKTGVLYTVKELEAML